MSPGALFVFTVTNLAIGVALASRCAEPSPGAIYGNNLAQQITSTFDVVVCALSLTVLIAMLFTGPLAGYLVRRREARTAAAPQPQPPSPEPPTAAAPTLGQSTQPLLMPKIVRLKEGSTTVIAAPPTEEFSAPTTALRIQRREPPSDVTTQLPTPPGN